MTHTVASTLLSASQHQRLISVARRYYGVFALLLRMAFAVQVASWWLPSWFARRTIVPALVLGTPALFIDFAMLNLDMLVILCRCFEFWFTLVLSALTCALMGIMLDDARLFSCVFCFFPTTLICCLDANVQTLVSTARSSVFWMIVPLSVVGICFQQRDASTVRDGAVETGSIALLAAAFTTSNTIVNVSLTLAMMVLNKTYKRRRVFQRRFPLNRVIPCATYRSKIMLVPDSEELRIASQGVAARRLPVPTTSLLQPVRCTRFKVPTIDCNDTLCPRFTLSAPLSCGWLLFLRLNGVIGLVLTGVSFGIGLGFFGQGTSPLQLLISAWLARVAMVPTCVFLFPFIASYQRHLLSRLVKNFDVVFCSFQFNSACICLADLLQWSAASWSIISWSLWFHWLLLLDAVAPPARSALSFRKRHAAPVFLAPLVDRVATLRLTESMIITLHSSTFMVYRLLTVVLWLLRLAFEVLCCSEQELMLIRGPLEDGYVVVPDTLTRDELRMLRRESEQLFRSLDDDPEIAAARVLEQGCVLDMMADCEMADEAPARVDSAAYMAARRQELRRRVPSPANDADADADADSILRALLFDKLPRLLRSLAPSRELFFFNEHYVVKPPRSAVEFRWHRDDDEQLAMCVHRDRLRPYVSLWCALDDVTTSNGPLRFVSLRDVSTAAERSSCALRDDDEEKLERLASAPVRVAAGSVVVFLSSVWHCSSRNESGAARRAFYAQYSWEKISASPSDPARSTGGAMLPIMIPLRLRNQCEQDARRAQQQYAAFRPTPFDDGATDGGPGSFFEDGEWNTLAANARSKDLSLYRTERDVNPTLPTTVQSFYDASESFDLGRVVRKKGSTGVALKSATPRFARDENLNSPQGPGRYAPEQVSRVTAPDARHEKRSARAAFETAFAIVPTPTSRAATDAPQCSPRREEAP
ncbi:hypothetical protein ATCC90586_009655 [Pythium insidiosum]|nr:hypothetical protein ATCC90586_009655 [Pythium insidiosum]